MVSGLETGRPAGSNLSILQQLGSEARDYLCFTQKPSLFYKYYYNILRLFGLTLLPFTDNNASLQVVRQFLKRVVSTHKINFVVYLTKVRFFLSLPLFAEV